MVEDLFEYVKINMYEDKLYFFFCYKKYGNGIKKFDMGFGWLFLKRNNNVMLYGGGIGCFSLFLGIDKENKVVFVVLVNYRLGRNNDEYIGMFLLESL